LEVLQAKKDGLKMHAGKMHTKNNIYKPFAKKFQMQRFTFGFNKKYIKILVQNVMVVSLLPTFHGL